MKICKLCNVSKELSEFIPKKQSKDNHTTYCKSCQKESQENFSKNNPFMECSCCDKIFPIDEFPKLNNSLRGYGKKSKHCSKTRTKAYWDTVKKDRNTDRRVENLTEEQIIKAREIKRRWSKIDPRVDMLSRAKIRAKKKGLEFNLLKTDFEIPTNCLLLGVKLKFGDKENYRYTPSLDRIDSSKGYIKGNVQVISYLANKMKNDANLEELKTFAQNIIKIYDIV